MTYSGQAPFAILTRALPISLGAVAGLSLPDAGAAAWSDAAVAGADVVARLWLAALEMTMEVVINPKLEGWVQQWLGEIAVLEPKKLRDDVRAAALKGIEDMDRYGGVEG